jgi:predicted DNA binding CopG/RHH family protein
MFTRAQRALQTNYRRCLSGNSFRNLRVGQAGLLACLEQSIRAPSAAELETNEKTISLRLHQHLLHSIRAAAKERDVPY